MRYPLIVKSSMLGFLGCVCALSVQAQKINEQELKMGVTQIVNPAAQLKNLEPVVYTYNIKKYKHLNLPEGEQYGFLASNVQSQFPEMVYETSLQYPSGKSNFKIATYSKVQLEAMIPVLVAAIKEQQEQIDQLRKELEALK